MIISSCSRPVAAPPCPSPPLLCATDTAQTITFNLSAHLISIDLRNIKSHFNQSAGCVNALLNISQSQCSTAESLRGSDTAEKRNNVALTDVHGMFEGSIASDKFNIIMRTYTREKPLRAHYAHIRIASTASERVTLIQ